MGAGASVEGGDQIEDQMYAQKSSVAMIGNTSAERSKTSLVSNSNVIKGSNNLLIQRSRILDGTEAVIHVAKTGFSEHEVTVTEGQVVDFIWEETTSNMSLVQVVHDGEKLRPVIGGYQVNPDECGGLYHQQFNIEGEYKFALSGIRCMPVTVNVKRKMDLEARVTDNGFQPSIIHVDQGHAITWSWKNCSVPHTMQEVTFLMDRGCFKKQSTNPSMVATVTGGYRQQFQRTGLYYFLTESGQEVGKTHLCIVHVLDAIREYKLEILDRSFQPMILLIEEGDRVWFLWDKFKCKKSHSVYQIEAPPIGYSDQEPYIPTKDGFRWSAPSKQGLLSHQFHKAGVFYFSDQNFDEAAEYIGTIIVKPKQKEHIVNLTEKGFIPDLLYAYTGDRVWWTWNGDSVTDLIENLLIVEEDKCLNPAAKNKPASPISEDLYHVLDGESAGLMTRVGLATNHFTTIGVYHYRIAETDDSVNTCSIIINPGSKNNTVHLTDNGFEPKVLTIRPNDRVWWVWQSCKKQHNILQVSHQGGRIDGGFSSGQPRDSPSAYVYQFISPGVYYFISANLPKLFGAIVVSTQPQVHEVTVSNTEIYPDPVTVQTNDIVCWVFRQPQFYDINQIETLDQLLDGQMSENLFSPRRCIGRAVSTSGSIHLVSKSFQKKKVTITDQVKLSSVICDDRYDNTTIRVDKKGFHPSKVYLNTGQSVLWNWKGTDEEHNIIHVNSPNSDEPLNVIEGVKSFNSGKLMKNNSFLYTFDEEGAFSVASQGAPGYSCSIYIKESAIRSSTPYIIDKNGGTVNRFTCIKIGCDTPGADIYYTLDGSPPTLYSDTTRKYKSEKGVKLRHPGLCFIRAISVADEFIISYILTSKRYWVLSKEDDVDHSGESGSEDLMNRKSQVILTAKTTDWDWLNCSPNLKGCFTGPGEMEIFWEQPPENKRHLIRGYNVKLNDVVYCPMFPVHNNSLHITGLAGGRIYQVWVEAFSKDNHKTLKSNMLNLRCPIINNDGGPVISLEVPQIDDSLSIVWMSIDTPECPVDGYIVYINDQQCGPKLVPDPNSNRCKVIIGSCVLHTPYKIYVDALIANCVETKMSNVIEVELPLDTSCISLPQDHDIDEELYCEFVEVHEGSGYLPEMEESSNKNDISGGCHRNGNDMGNGGLSDNDMKQLKRKRKATDFSKEIELEDYLQHPAEMEKKVIEHLVSDVSTDDERKYRYRKRKIKSKKQRNQMFIVNGVPVKEGLSKKVGEIDEAPSRQKGKGDNEQISDEKKDQLETERIQKTGNIQDKRHSNGLPTLQQDDSGDYLTTDDFEESESDENDFKKGAKETPNIYKLEDQHQQSKNHPIIEVEKRGIDCTPLSQRKQVLQTWPSIENYSKTVDERKSHEFEQSRDEFYIEDDLKRNIPFNLVATQSANSNKFKRSFYAVARFIANFIGAQKRLLRLKGPSSDQNPPLQWGMLKNVFSKARMLENTLHLAQTQNVTDNDHINHDRILLARKSSIDSCLISPDTLKYSSGPPVKKNKPNTRKLWSNSLQRKESENVNNMQLWTDTLKRQQVNITTVPRQNSHPLSGDARKSREDFALMRQTLSSEDDARFSKPPLNRRHPERIRSGHGCLDYSKYARPQTHPEHPKDQSSPKSAQELYQDDIDSVTFDSEFDILTERSYIYGNEHNQREHVHFEKNEIDSHKTLRKEEQTEKQLYDSYKYAKNLQQAKQSKREYERLKQVHYAEQYQAYQDTYSHEEALERYFTRGQELTHNIIKDNFQHKEMNEFPLQINYDEKNVLPPKEYGGMLDRYLECLQYQGKEVDSVADEENDGVSHTQRSQNKGRDLHNVEYQNSKHAIKHKPTECSDSESETDSSDWATDDEDRYKEKNFIILDATNNTTTDTTNRNQNKKKRNDRHKEKPHSSRKHFSPRKGKYINVDGNDMDDYNQASGHSGTKLSDRKNRRNTTAIIEVQQTVELDIQDGGLVEEGQENREQKKLAVPVSSKSNMLPVGEGEFIMGDGDGILPAPSIMVESRGKKGIQVMWELPESPDPKYKLLLYVVNVVGVKFSKEINSDISFECNLVEKGEPVRGVQHCWNIQGEDKCNIKGLLPGLTYRIYVIANYTLLHGDQPCEIQTTSSVLYYTTMGPPKPPPIRVKAVDFYQATLKWDPPNVHPDVRLKGYKIYIDDKPLGELRGSDVRQMIVNNMIPGKTVRAHVVAVTSKASQESEPSKTIHITCPRRPPTPFITQQPSYKKGCVLIAWEKPKGHTNSSNDEAISSYSVYIDGSWHGEVKANKVCDQQGYQFFLTDLSPEQSYDVTVKTISGYRCIDPESQHVYCLSDSPMSNIVTVRAPAAPMSPKLRLEGLHPQGVDVTWQVPQQFGDAVISGYQMLKNGKLYGAIIPPDVNSLKIKDINLGEKLDLQLIALTEHPVGKNDKSSAGSGFYGEKDSGIGSSNNPDAKGDVLMGERYSGCKPGPKLGIHYTGLVQPPSQVACERVTGHSALIVWNKEHGSKSHYVTADSYQVTWWPGNNPLNDINSDSTTEDHLLINNLKPSTTYTVIVEARKMEKYTDIDESSNNNETPNGLNAFILTASSDQICVITASPPNPPRNLGITATTCNSLTIAWDPPEEHGVEVIGIRIECVALDISDPHYVVVDVMPDIKKMDIHNLHEKKDYTVRVIAVTDEYFDRLPDNHPFKKSRNLGKEILIKPEDSIWLPNNSILAKTAGTEQPANMKIITSSMTSVTLHWTPPLVYGSNKLLGQIVRWYDVKTCQNEDKDLVVANHVNVGTTEDTFQIENLSPGVQYKIVVEAVVSIKTSLNAEKKDLGIDKYRRTAHVMSKPLLARTRAPVESPKLIVTSYNQSDANLYWEKPPLFTVIGKDEQGKPKYLRRYLEGYKLEVNGKLQCYLGPSAQNCTLTKCKAGKVYCVVLVALTCTEESKKSRKQKFKGFFKNINPQDLDYEAILDDDENLDESLSEPVKISLPKDQEGFLCNLQAGYICDGEKDNEAFGEVVVTWQVQGKSNLIKQFTITWFCIEDRVIQCKYISADQRKCAIPINKLKTIYNIGVEPGYYTDVIEPTLQDVQVMIPGPPDPPEIYLRSVDLEEFVIEWGEPKLFGGVKIKAYQVYMNDKKVGRELSSSHRKAVIPCRQNRTYRIHLIALSSSVRFGDSLKSNSLLINTSNTSPRYGEQATIEEWSSTGDDHEIPVKVTKILDTAIQLDWSNFIDTDEIAFYKIQWSSVAQPAQREVKLSSKDSNCVINKCLPGTNHFVRLLAYDKNNQIMEKSKQMTIQTSAQPDAPVLSLRASNFRYLVIQWEKPTEYGDALCTGYKVFVNGIVESNLASDQISYTFTHGKWCHEYSFQLQALTGGDKMNSRISDPLIVTWPGAKPPPIHRIPSVCSSTLCVGWEQPYLTEGVKVKHFKLCCIEEDTEKLVQAVGPIHPDTREAEIKNLKKGNYSVYLETYLYGTGDVVRSDMIRMQPSLSPDAPEITVTIVGLEERRQLEKLCCDLVNKRDRLIRAVGYKLKKIGALSHPVKAEKDEDIIIGAHTLTRVEELLEECFAVLEQYTGQLIVHVSWQCPQSNPDMCISSYKVLIDGKQYGNALHAGVKTVKVKLDLSEPNYRLTMVAMTDKPQGTSDESNVVELLTSPFQPFVFYCYHSIHNREAKWPNPGCCRYEDSTAYERQVGKKLANQGLLQKHVPPPACSIFDIFAGEYKPLMTTHKPQFPTVILFWTPWCQSSVKLLDYYVRFARETHKEFNFIAVTCGVSGISASDRNNLVHLISSKGWRDDSSIWHCTSECSSSMYQPNFDKKNGLSGHNTEDIAEEKRMDLIELLGVAGVPTLFIVHPEGYLVWHGRYCAFDYAAFIGFMRHILSEILCQPCPVYNCDNCQNNMSIDEEALGFLAHEPKSSTTKNVRITCESYDSSSISGTRNNSPPADSYNNGYSDISNGSEKMCYRHKGSPKKKNGNSRISLDLRPVSASSLPVQYHRSPYLAQIVPSSSRISRFGARPSSARKSNY